MSQSMTIKLFLLLLTFMLALGCKSQEALDTELVNAVKENNVNKVKELLERGASVEAKEKEYGEKVLSIASGEGYKAIVELLLLKGAQVDAASGSSKNTALHQASSRRRIEIVKLLISRGADVNKKNDAGRTPLSYASRSGELDMIRYLVKKGARFNEYNIISQNALMEAIDANKLEAVKLLVELGADVDAHRERGPDVLLVAVRSSSLGDNIELIKFLVSKGANLSYGNVTMKMVNNVKNETDPVQKNKYKKILQVFIDKGGTAYWPEN